MGFFSWSCKCCGESAKSGNDWMGKVVIVSDDASIIRGEYDGYGRVDGSLGGEIDLTDADGEFALYHAACYGIAGKPFDGPSLPARDQGLGESEVEPKTLEDVEAIKARRVQRSNEQRAAARVAYAEIRQEYLDKGESVPEWLA